MMLELDLAPDIENAFNRLPWCQRASPSTTRNETVDISTDADRMMLNMETVKWKFRPMNPTMVKRAPHTPWPLSLLPIGSADSADAEREKCSQRPGELETVGSANDIFGETSKITRETRVLHLGNVRFPARGNVEV